MRTARRSSAAAGRETAISWSQPEGRMTPSGAGNSAVEADPMAVAPFNGA